MMKKTSKKGDFCHQWYQSGCTRVCLQSLQIQTTINVSLTVLQSVYLVFFKNHTSGSLT